MYLKNIQGDIIAVVNESGQSVITYTYNAWGKFNQTVAAGDNEDIEIMEKYLPFAYRGYCYDYDTGLYYLQSRYYSPEMGRFINTDDTHIAIATQGTVLGANLFSYCENNPVNRMDPSGFYYIKLSKIAKVLLYIIGFNPIGATLLYVGYKKLKMLIVAKMAIIGAKLGSFYVPLKVAFAVLFSVLGLTIGSSIASALWECANTGKKGIEFTIRKNRWGIPYKLDIYAR